MQTCNGEGQARRFANKPVYNKLIQFCNLLFLALGFVVDVKSLIRLPALVLLGY